MAQVGVVGLDILLADCVGERDHLSEGSGLGAVLTGQDSFDLVLLQLVF